MLAQRNFLPLWQNHSNSFRLMELTTPIYAFGFLIIWELLFAKIGIFVWVYRCETFLKLTAFASFSCALASISCFGLFAEMIIDAKLSKSFRVRDVNLLHFCNLLYLVQTRVYIFVWLILLTIRNLRIFVSMPHQLFRDYARCYYGVKCFTRVSLINHAYTPTNRYPIYS
jgi:hypothetical protein